MTTSSTLRRLSLAAAGLCLGGSLLAPLAAPAAGAASLVRNGGWWRLSDSGVTSLSQPDALPVGAGMQAVWSQQDSSSSESVRSRTVSTTGVPGATVTPVVTGWATVVDDPKIISTSAGRMVVFGGIRTTNPGERYYGPMAYATSPTGASWTLGPGSLTQTIYAYGSYGTDAVSDGGTPLVSVIASSSSFVTLHRGVDPDVPASTPDWTTTPTAKGNALSASIARDPVTGQTWAAWYCLVCTPAQDGILAQKVHPTPVGTVTRAPGSSTGGSSLSPDQGVALAARSSGGVWVAYKIGYPTANRIGLWRVGTRTTWSFPAPDVDRVFLSPGPGGTLWVAWYSSTSNVVRVARTNAGVSRLGAVRTLALPAARGSYSNLWSFGGTGAVGPMNLLVNAQIGVAAPQIWYQRVLPGLTVTLSRASVGSGPVTVTVSDAGAPVVGARVVFAGQVRVTGSRGTAVVTVATSLRSGRYPVVATRSGYAPGSASLRVT